MLLARALVVRPTVVVPRRSKLENLVSQDERLWFTGERVRPVELNISVPFAIVDPMRVGK